MRLILVVLLLAAPTLAPAQTNFYQCEDEHGRPVFSERPCGKDAVKGSVEGPAQSGSVTGGDFSSVTAGNAIREAQREINRREDKINRFEELRDTKLDLIDAERRTASNNLAGAQYLDSLATQARAVNEQYSAKIAEERRKIDRLQDKISSVDNARSF